MKYKIEKVLDGFSICFRQWQATHSHCHFLHGYAISFKLYFEANSLDQCNWVWDFGWMKDHKYTIDNRQVKEWFNFMFDHTTIIAEDDPELDTFIQLSKNNIIQLRIIPHQSCEKIAEFVLLKLNKLVTHHSNDRVLLRRVDVYEHDKNCASCEL